MKNLDANDSAPKVERKLGVVSARLHAHPETKTHAPRMLTLREQLKADREAHELTVVQRMAQTALVGWLDKPVDKGMARLSRAYLEVFDNNREDPTFLRAFPTNVSESTASTGGDTQHHFVRIAIAETRAWPEAPQHIKDLAEQLALDQTALEDGQRDLAAAYVKEAQAWSTLQITLTGARNAYNQLYIHLRDRLPGHKALIDSIYS